MLHLRAVFEALQHHVLFLKKYKCSYGQPSVCYLGHVISAQVVAMDETKVKVVLSWPVPKTVWAVRGFLGIAGHYQHFIRDYGRIVAPLTKLLHKDGFQWLEEATTAFRVLQ